MKILHHAKCGKIAVVMSSASKSGLFSDWAADSEPYNNFVHSQAKLLVAKIKSNPSALIKVAASVTGYVLENYTEPRAHDFAVDLINSMALQVEKK